MSDRDYHSREWCNICRAYTDYYSTNGHPPECGRCAERAEAWDAAAVASARATGTAVGVDGFVGIERARLVYLRWRVKTGRLRGDVL